MLYTPSNGREFVVAFILPIQLRTFSTIYTLMCYTFSTIHTRMSFTFSTIHTRMFYCNERVGRKY